MDKNDFLYEKETYEIRGACFAVWKHFGSSFRESIIDKSLTLELQKRGLKVEDQKRLDISYSGQKVGTYIPDKAVNDKIMIELKCKEFIKFQDKRQFWHYLKASPYKLGLLINFSPRRVEIFRRIYDQARKEQY